MNNTMMTRAQVMGIRFADGGDEQQGAAPQEVPVPSPAPTTVNVETRPAYQTQERPALPNGENGYPENTPLDAMSDAQQAAYWKHKSRAHENKWKQVIDKNLTPEQVLEMQQKLDEADRERMDDHQREVDDAKKTAAREARDGLMPQLVQARIEAAVARLNPDMTDEDIASRLEFADLTKFLTPKGEVDAGKVSNYAATLAPAAPADDGKKKKFPDMGGGTRGPLNVSAKERAKQNARERGYVRDAK